MSGPYDAKGPHGWINRVIENSKSPVPGLTAEQYEALRDLIAAASHACATGSTQALRTSRERAKKVFGLK